MMYSQHEINNVKITNMKINECEYLRLFQLIKTSHTGLMNSPYELSFVSLDAFYVFN